MYNNVYQEYINNMIGGMPRSQSTFENSAMPNFQSQNSNNIDIERFYPELYKLLYPMIKTACMRNTKPITEETIDEMVMDIYSNFNADNVTILNINLTNDVRSTSKTNEAAKAVSSKMTSKVTEKTKDKLETETRNLRPNNYVLSDLIRILLIRELLGTPANIVPIRPGFSHTQKPGSGRHPFSQRNFEYDKSNYDIYEQFNI